MLYLELSLFLLHLADFDRTPLRSTPVGQGLIGYIFLLFQNGLNSKPFKKESLIYKQI